MGKGTLTIFSASAGSGKTYTLTEIYLTSLFHSRYNYRKILAVTFTNKATAEMKSRILESLYKLASGKPSDYLSKLMKDTGRSEEWIRKEAGDILLTILHDYSRFSISTIDSFFQKILRAFIRDVGLQSGFNVELDHSAILSSAVDEMLGSAVEGTVLNRWLTKYALANIEEEKSWNLRDNILNLSEELFRERFKILYNEGQAKLADKEFLMTFIGKLSKLVSSFEKELQDAGKKALDIYARYDLSDDMFFRKSQGVPGYIRAVAAGVVKEPNQAVGELRNSPPRWSTAAPAEKLKAAIADGLEETLTGVLKFYDENLKDYKTAKIILANIYSLGILSDILGKIRDIIQDENSFLLSDAGDVLSQITGEDQSPFIYEKVGNRYENFMIDEFQDTSALQWKNLQPLLENSMAEGYDNLVVGDVKQSIYRWRNSDWKILGVELNRRIDNDRIRSIPLTGNWRSLSGIIRFNNTLFSVIPELLDRDFEGDVSSISFSKIYSEAVQSEPVAKPGGYVRIEFVENDADSKAHDKILTMLPETVEKLQDNGYSASDIGILVRDGREGADVLRTFIDYGNNAGPEKKERYNYNIVSGDSLLLSNSHVINFIISVLRHIDTPDDMISRAGMIRYYLLCKNSSEADTVCLVGDMLDETSEKYFPSGYKNFLTKLRQMPLFEATESIIGFFGLGENSSAIAYLSTFQDHVVHFTGSRTGDLHSFLDWWSDSGSGKSVVLPGDQNAMRILTIHKSKGLEFRVVIIPFLTWPLDHMPSKQPFLWIKPAQEPFAEIGLVPVRYSSDLKDTWFAPSYYEEKHSIYVDNINLLYVALTRAREVIYGFSGENTKKERTIAGLIQNAFMAGINSGNEHCIDLGTYYDKENHVFSFGQLPEVKGRTVILNDFRLNSYDVGLPADSLKLRLHGEDFFKPYDAGTGERINHGRIMHGIFEKILTVHDIVPAVRTAVGDGLVAEEESEALCKRIKDLMEGSEVLGWFSEDNKILTEASILLPSGNTRRPDRVIFRKDKTLVIDFKFGDESSSYAGQVNQYMDLLSEMGYPGVEGYVWYVDREQIKKV